MRISYVTSSSERVASFRYRIQAPVEELRKRGVDCTVDRKADPDAEIVVFSKHWTENDYSYALFCRARGQRVVFDICDEHFSNDKYRTHYLRMAGVAHLITVNSETMRGVVQKETGKESVVIVDPVLSTRRVYDPTREERGLWFGQGMNFSGLVEVYPEGCKRPLLLIVPNIPNPPQKFLHEEVHAVPWAIDALDEYGDKVSYALLPYRQGKPAKSANRVLEALNLGLPVLTDRIPSVAALGNDGVYDLRTWGGFEEGVNFLSTHKEQIAAEMLKAQTLIDEQYSVQAITNQWENLFEELA